MKGRKDDDKMMGPLFPRLHVNDTDKGGPRAPPRNKMALYEQLSIPSQRFNAAAASAFPPPKHNSSSLVHSATGSQGFGHERSHFSPFCMPPYIPAHPAEKFNSRSSDGVNPNATCVEFEKRSINHAENRNLNAVGLTAECNSPQPLVVNNSNGKKHDDEDDFRVPTLINSRVVAHSNKDLPPRERQKLAHLSASTAHKSCSATACPSVQLSRSYERRLEQIETSDTKASKSDKRNIEQKAKDNSTVREQKENFISHNQSREKSAGPSNIPIKPSNQGRQIAGHGTANSRLGSTMRHQESCVKVFTSGPRCSNDVDAAADRDISRVRDESCTRASLGISHQSANAVENCSDENDDRATRSLGQTNADRSDEVSEASMVDSISRLEVSPNDVVGVIGQKHFWKARRAILNQQRVFAVQVFELHRLIKVQKLFAASPNILLEVNPCLKNPQQKLTSKNVQPEHTAKSQHRQKPIQNIVCSRDNVTGVQPLASHEDGVNKEPSNQIPRSSGYAGNLPQIAMASENKSDGWYFHPPANQWLVPVMSPSEGLLYKPYTGPCPPPAGFMASVYGSPLSLAPVAGEFMSPAYGVPGPHLQQQNMGVLSGAAPIAPNFFPALYPLPTVNPVFAASAVEQVSPLAGSHPNGYAEQHSRSSCNMANPRSEAFSGRIRKFQPSKDCELQGSTAISPCEKAQGEGRNALPLFPMSPVAETSNHPSQSGARDNQTRVIKVVPHNRRSATESAARIFRSIQKERKQHDS